MAGLRSLALLAFLGTLLAGCPRSVPRDPAPPRAPTPDAVLFVTASLDGTLEPCGCSAALKGGLARTAQVIASAREAGLPVTYLDAGDALFPSPVASSERALPQERSRAHALARAMEVMGLSVRVLGPKDRAGGDGAAIPVLPTLEPEAALRLPTSEAQVPLHVVTGETHAALRSALARTPAPDGAFVIALLPLPLEQALTLDAGGLGIDLVIASGMADGALEADTRIVHQGGVPHVSLERRGRALLRVDVAVHAETTGLRDHVWQPGADELAREATALAARIALLDEELDRPEGASDPLRPLKREKARELQARRAALSAAPLPALRPGHFSLRVVPIDPTLPEEPAVAALVAAHNAEVGALNLAWARSHGADCPPSPEGRATYVGNEACVTCHPEAGAVWAKTKHARAWDTLVQVGKQHHLDCIGCHVVGWQQAGGVCRLDRTDGRRDVGCESCHGPGSLHAEAGDAAKLQGRPDEARCRTCHNAEHSPHFDFATWRPQVLGPGHGAPPDDAR